MADCEYPVYSNLWFWLIALGILFLAIGLIIWDVRAQLAESWWVWTLIFGGALLLIIGIIIAVWQWWRQDGLDVDLFDEEPIPNACPAPVTAQRTTTTTQAPPVQRTTQQTTIQEAPPVQRTTRRRVVQQETVHSNDPNFAS